MEKLVCNTSGLTVKDVKCYVRSISRDFQVMNMAFPIVRKVDKVFVSNKRLFHHRRYSNIQNFEALYTLTMKTTSTWRHLIKLDNIDACSLLVSMQDLPFLDAVRIYYKTYFPCLPQRCPIDPGNYTVTNVTVTDNRNGNPGEKLMLKVTPVSLPNGLYRHAIRFFTKDDPLGATMLWHTRIDIRMNDDKFWKWARVEMLMIYITSQFLFGLIPSSSNSGHFLACLNSHNSEIESFQKNLKVSKRCEESKNSTINFDCSTSKKSRHFHTQNTKSLSRDLILKLKNEQKKKEITQSSSSWKEKGLNIA